MSIEEVKKIILTDDEVDEYNKLINNLDELVEEGVTNSLNNMSFFQRFKGFFIGLCFGIAVVIFLSI